ncbi:MAG: gamma-glutamyltransferase family protein [Armatimonadetes bacterium]|nr:gamma-glutamyltransferase family protein [Armatimonadota bacterium]
MPAEVRVFRPVFRGQYGVVSAGHYLAAMAGHEILRRGGNAVDAGVAAGICINVTRPDGTSFGGVAPMIIYLAEAGRVTTIDGLGVWPKKATMDHYKTRLGGKLSPTGLDVCVTPAAADAWMTALARHGTMSFEQVIAPALDLAEHGFPVHDNLARAIRTYGDDLLRNCPTTAEVLMPNGVPPRPGEILRMPALARTFRSLIEAERRTAGTRAQRITAARDHFYKGPAAWAMDAFSRARGGLVTYEDIAAYAVQEGPPERIRFGDVEAYTCGPWCQGPSFAQILKLLEGFPLRDMGHNSPDYVHTLVECIKLGFADREGYYGDPNFVDVPMTALLSDAYCAERRGAVDRQRAYPGFPEPGRVPGYTPYIYQPPADEAPPPKAPVPAGEQSSDRRDTSYLAVIDRYGNIFSCTPSDNIIAAHVVPEVGTIISTRGRQSRIDPRHPSALGPGRRPRLTPNPALVLKDGQPYMAIGTPGGDSQVQAMVQVFLNIMVFGMDVQEAIEAPRLVTHSFPDSFYPHVYRPREVSLEAPVHDACAEDLIRRGHVVHRWSRLARDSTVCVVRRDPATGTLEAGADPRGPAYAAGW